MLLNILIVVDPTLLWCEKNITNTTVMLNSKPLKVSDSKTQRTKKLKMKNLIKPCMTARGIPACDNKTTAIMLFPVTKNTKTDSITLFNRFEMLADMSDTDNSQVHKGTNASFHLRGNKNRKGQTLGTALVKQVPQVNSMESFTTFKGNKNKTGQILGNSMPEQHASLTFRGNKNGNGLILGSMLHTTNEDNMNACQSHTRSQDNTSIGDTASAIIPSPNVLHEDIQCQTDINGSGQNSLNQAITDNVLIWDINSIAPVTAYRRKKHIPESILFNKYQSLDHKNCINQNTKAFGFIPYNGLLRYTGPNIVWASVPDIVQAHQLVRQSGMPNFMQVRIPVNSQLKVEAWKKYLHEYWDKQLIDLIEYGFPLDFDRKCTLESTHMNHASAIKHSEHVADYIQTEMQYGAIYGPFAQTPFPCHISPFLTRDKPNSNKRRVILDLSFPSGNSVNDGVPKDKYLGSYFDLKYPSVDHIVNSLKQLGPDALLYKIDISRAFRHLKIDPGDIDLLGLKHESYFIDGTLPFGFRHGSVLFQRCSDAIRFIMSHTFGYANLYNYIDDLVYTSLPGEIHRSYQTLLALLQELGLEVSQSKLIEPTSSAICLGIEINSVNRTLSIPNDKLSQIQQICREYVTKTKVTKNQYQSLLGSLLILRDKLKEFTF